ncbi:hypothetical protein BN982_02173 [Halobacillus karajensis]|uniref:Uncharacterized protein n=2 Tax=Halobacillus karajensis TaxID=195088 RepID=A0A024P329_9BACI|nr:hypothetical protein BN982_02173 [Halobacillus karajensis]CDQ22326.1 hypothetical protein BN983_00534 [Halobacillus karajensis]CDQ28167.1 hypothetical protein BN981_02461 [Halobacillus karajensis]
MVMVTDHERASLLFEDLLEKSIAIKEIELKKIAGIPFVYLMPAEGVTKRELEDILKWCASKAMKGKRLTLAMSYVRKNQAFYVYRVRFLVPQRKMFCCGNLCDDCIRFTEP